MMQGIRQRVKVKSKTAIITVKEADIPVNVVDISAGSAQNRRLITKANNISLKNSRPKPRTTKHLN